MMYPQSECQGVFEPWEQDVFRKRRIADNLVMYRESQEMSEGMNESKAFDESKAFHETETLYETEFHESKSLLGNFAASKAGHDKKQVYVIVDQDEKYVYLCDGRLKPLSGPKKKNIKHIQIINRKADRDLLERLLNKETIFDEQIKYAIKQYHKR